MRITTAWAKTAAENIGLKLATVSLSLGCLVLSIGLLRLALSEPIIIDRGCFSKILKSESQKNPTIDETKAFIREVLIARFDSEPSAMIISLSLQEQSNRIKEQELLKQKRMSQKIIVGSVDFVNGNFIVEADRIIAMGKVKTILPFAVKVEIQKTQRTEVNPYGLILTNVSSFKKETGGH